MIGRIIGSVTDANAGLVRAHLPGAAIGEGVAIHAGQRVIRGIVRGVAHDVATIAPSGAIDGVVAGDVTTTLPAALTLPLGMSALGRAFDSCGAPLDGGGAIVGIERNIQPDPPSAAQRLAIASPLWTGVRAIDALLTIGRGARVGLFGAPGAGKSTLLSMLARGMSADALVIGLIGERGREAAQWIEGRAANATVICAPSDRSPAERIAAAKAAAAQAAELRTRGLDVLLILDSLARFGSALREVAVACGEPVGRGGFPASVFAEIARLVESAGKTRSGSVTLVATVLSDGMDERDPLSDAARSLLDGHIVLSSALAHAGRYPAIDVLASASRTMNAVATPQHARNAQTVRRALAALRETEDARALGMPVADPAALRASAAQPELERFLAQGELLNKHSQTLEHLAALADTLDGSLWI